MRFLRNSSASFDAVGLNRKVRRLRKSRLRSAASDPRLSGRNGYFRQWEDFKEGAIEFDGHAGREFVYTAEVEGNTLDFHVRCYRVESRLYVLQALGLPELVRTENVERFFDSFKLVPDSEEGSDAGPQGDE